MSSKTWSKTYVKSIHLNVIFLPKYTTSFNPTNIKLWTFKSSHSKTTNLSVLNFINLIIIIKINNQISFLLPNLTIHNIFQSKGKKLQNPKLILIKSPHEDTKIPPNTKCFSTIILPSATKSKDLWGIFLLTNSHKKKTSRKKISMI